MALVRTDYGLIYNTDGSLCATLLPDGGVAVTEGTTNLCDPAYMYTNTWTTIDYAWNRRTIIDCSAGDVFTISADIKELSQGSDRRWGYVAFYDSGGIELEYHNAMGSGMSEQRLSFTTPAAPVGTVEARVYWVSDRAGFSYQGKNYQIEKKPYTTPFAEGTRPAGILPYPADIINLDHTTWAFEWEPWQNLDSMTGIAEYPKILSVGGYFVNNSFVLWYYGGVIRLYIKGSTNTDWSKFSDWTPPQDWYKQGKKYKFALQLTNRDTIKVYLDGIKIIETTISDPFTGIANNRWWIGNNTLLSFANAVFRNMRIINNRHTSEDEIKTWHSLDAPFYDPNDRIDAGARPIYAPGVIIDSTGAWGISGGVKQAGFGTDGRWVAGGGKVVSDAQGLRTYDKPYTDPAAVKQVEIGTDGALIFGGGAGRADSEGMILYDISDPANPKPMIRFVGKTGSADFEGVVKAKTLVVPVGTNRWG